MLEYLHVVCAPPMVQIANKRVHGLKVVAPCTDDDIVIEVIFVYIFSLKPFDFGDANSLKVYMFPLKPLGFWIRQYLKPLRVYTFS